MSSKKVGNFPTNQPFPKSKENFKTDPLSLKITGSINPQSTQRDASVYCSADLQANPITGVCKIVALLQKGLLLLRNDLANLAKFIICISSVILT